MKHILFALVLIQTFHSPLAKADGEIAVVVNVKNRINKLSMDEVRDIFLGSRQYSDEGQRIQLADQDRATKICTDFYQKVAAMDAKGVSVHWARLVFSGKGRPPVRLATDEAVLTWLDSNVAGIGYINAKSAADPRVKVVLDLP